MEHADEEASTVMEGGGPEPYTVSPNLVPSEDVTVSLTGGDLVAVAPTTLTFTAGNWDAPLLSWMRGRIKR